MKSAAGMCFGFWLAILLAPWDTASRANTSGKTAQCVEHKPWLMSKKYNCTPAEASALQRDGRTNPQNTPR